MRNIRKYFSRRYNKSKNCIVAILTVAAMILLSGCTTKGTNEVTSIKVGVAIYDQYDVFISGLLGCINEDFSKISSETGIPISIQMENASGSQSLQNNQVKSMINNGCNVLCINLVDRTDTSYIIDLAEEKNIPVVFFNREPVTEDLTRGEHLYYVGADAAESGLMEGELFTEYYRNHSDVDKNGDGIVQYILMEGEAGHQDAIVRSEYSVSTIESSGIAMERIDHATANWNRDQAKAKMLQMLNDGEYAELVLSNNDVMAIGVLDAYKEKETDRSKWPVVFGIDGVAAALDAVNAGEMQATVYNDKEGQAYAIVNLAYALATGGDISGFDLTDGKYIRLPYQKITIDNVDKFIK